LLALFTITSVRSLRGREDRNASPELRIEAALTNKGEAFRAQTAGSFQPQPPVGFAFALVNLAAASAVNAKANGQGVVRLARMGEL
jgi:hypothetical protein